MANTLYVSTIEKASGDPVDLTGQSAIKAHGYMEQGAGGSSNTLNVSSYDDDGTGDFGVNFTSNFADATYVLTFGEDDGGNGSYLMSAQLSHDTNAVGSFDFETTYVGSAVNRTNWDGMDASFMAIGDLA